MPPVDRSSSRLRVRRPCVSTVPRPRAVPSLLRLRLQGSPRLRSRSSFRRRGAPLRSRLLQGLAHAIIEADLCESRPPRVPGTRGDGVGVDAISGAGVGSRGKGVQRGFGRGRGRGRGFGRASPVVDDFPQRWKRRRRRRRAWRRRRHQERLLATILHAARRDLAVPRRLAIRRRAAIAARLLFGSVRVAVMNARLGVLR